MNDNFFESLKQTLTDTAEAVGKKTEDVLEVQKFRSKISYAKKNVEVDYKKLGMIMCDIGSEKCGKPCVFAWKSVFFAST